jgi:hypothetical protein
VSSHPVRSFRIVGGIALVVSFLNPLLQLAGHWLPATGMNLPIFWTMIVMHCVSALITISGLSTLAVERARPLGPGGKNVSPIKLQRERGGRWSS